MTQKTNSELSIVQLKQQFFSDDEEAVWKAAEILFARLEDEESIILLHKKLDLLRLARGNINLKKQVKRVLRLEKAKSLRSYLAPEYRIKIFDDALVPDCFAEEILEFADDIPNRAWKKFFDTVRNRLMPGSKLILCNKTQEIYPFKAFYEYIPPCTRIPDVNTQTKPDTLYPLLEKKDFQLAELWDKNGGAGNSKNKEFRRNQMLSARAAEKAACTFYRQFGYHVSDISITQLDEINNDYVTCDLSVLHPSKVDTIYLDVKNSRTPFNNKRRYVEYCVPRFKIGWRNGTQVRIVGILSPYIKFDDPIQENFDPKLPDITYLGEVQESIVKHLIETFEKKDFLIINKMQILPPWVFEYPKTLYQKQDDYRAIIKKFESWNIPDWATARLSFNPVPAFLGSGVEIPPSWRSAFSEHQLLFIDQLKPRITDRVTLPELYLHVFSHFLRTATSGSAIGYDPMDYWDLIYTNPRPFEHKEDDEYHPLGLFDPLNIIANLIHTLSRLWKQRYSTNLKAFVLFKFNGLGLLEGKLKGSNQFKTILAYCGGFIPELGKCGYSPLILGVEDSCPDCGKLICPKCGFCSQTCAACEKRMQKMKEELDQKKSSSKDFTFAEMDEYDFPTSNGFSVPPPEEPPLDFLFGGESLQEELPF